MIDIVLKNIMFKRGLKTAEVARLSGIPQTTLHHLVSGDSTQPRRDTINALLEFFKINEAQLFGHEPIDDLGVSTPIAAPKGWQEIPIYTWEDVVNFARSGKKEKQNGIGRTFTSAEVDDKAFLIQLTDQSMYPQFPEGAEIIVNTEVEPTDRDMVIIYIKQHDKAYFRMIVFNGLDKFIRPLHQDLLSVGMERLNLNEDIIIGTFVEARVKR